MGSIEDYKCKVEEKSILICNGCGLEIYQCDVCKEYLMLDCFCGCIPDGRHLCENCFEDWYEECDSELRAKQEMKNENNIGD
jgi:hypothetical protein